MTNSEIVKRVKKMILGGINIEIDYGNTMALTKYKHGSYLLEFIVNYELLHNDYLPSTRSNPEEFSTKIEINSVENFLVYINNEMVDLTDEQTEDLQCCLLDELQSQTFV